VLLILIFTCLEAGLLLILILAYFKAGLLLILILAYLKAGLLVFDRHCNTPENCYKIFGILLRRFPGSSNNRKIKR